ncbi:MAG: hypothetical protein E7422_00065 [Ruminococcaceae bacterium]|nr:hypothetical protein [Oscillospiraceae bacterium]
MFGVVEYPVRAQRREKRLYPGVGRNDRKAGKDRCGYRRLTAGAPGDGEKRRRASHSGYSRCSARRLPLLLYNGKRGRGLKWLFYAFYPGHLLLLLAIKRLMG